MSGRPRPRSASRNSRSRSNIALTGTYIPFRSFCHGIDDDSSNEESEAVELRYQTITMLPEYRDKSLDELRLEDYKVRRHIQPRIPAAITLPAFVPTYSLKISQVVNPFIDNVFAARSQSTDSNTNGLGTYIQFQPFIGIGCVAQANRKLEVRYHNITIMPEYSDKCVEELRLEDYAARRLNSRRQRPASTYLRPPVFRFGENQDNFFLPAEKAPIFDFDTKRSRTSVSGGPFSFFPNNTSGGLNDRTATVVSENRNSSPELSGDISTANSQQTTQFDEFEDHALKIPLQSLRLQIIAPSKAILDEDKFIATRAREYCNVFVTFSSKMQTDQFVVIQILETNPIFISGLRLYIKDYGGSHLRRKLLYSDIYCKRNDFLIVWLNEDGEIKVIKNTSKKFTSFSLPKIKSGQYQLLGDMCGSVNQLRAFIGDRKKAEPFPWTRTTNRCVLSVLTHTMNMRSSLSLICELQDDMVIPVDIDFSQNLSTEVKKSEKNNRSESSNEDKSCKICLDRAANVVFIPCGHLCLCSECSLKMKLRQQHTCPICRRNIQSTQRVYFS